MIFILFNLALAWRPKKPGFWQKPGFCDKLRRQKSNILSAWGLKKPGFFKKPGFWRANYHCSVKMTKVLCEKPGFLGLPKNVGNFRSYSYSTNTITQQKPGFCEKPGFWWGLKFCRLGWLILNKYHHPAETGFLRETRFLRSPWKMP